VPFIIATLSLFPALFTNCSYTRCLNHVGTEGNAQILFDRFHIVKHLNEAVDVVRRELWRRLTSKERTTFKGTRWLLLKNPWNLKDNQKERLSTLVIVKDVDTAFGTDGFFEEIKKKGWKGMNSYTHSGLLQLAKRFKGSRVEPNYSDEAIMEQWMR
jgi:hypothetical protein